jgi:hypothetical protein
MLELEPLMWVLMYVFSYSVSPAATNDRAEWRLLPTVVFQEFSNEERCKAAKSTLEASLGQAGARLKSGLEDLKALGKADPSQAIIAYNVECPSQIVRTSLRRSPEGPRKTSRRRRICSGTNCTGFRC